MRREWMHFTYSPTMIAEGSRMKGDLTFVSTTQIHGIVEGGVEQTTLETLHIGPTGWIHGEIVSKGPVTIEGRVDGDITSDTSIQLTATATVSGALKAPTVRVMPGALFQGEVQMHSKVKALPRRNAG